jgi:hypothetical protein
MPVSRRDLTLAAASGAVLLTVLGFFDAVDALADLRAVALGVGTGVAVEAAFLAGTRVVEWWKRPRVAPASAVGLVVATAAVAAWLGPVVVAAACWGLATYLVVLAGTLAVAPGRVEEGQ